MARLTRGAYALFMLVLSWSLIQAQEATSPAVRAAMQKFIDSKEVAGAVAVVGRKDAVLAYEVVGQRDLEKKLPMTKNTLFRIASMTKPITAIAVLILQDDGKLSVDDPVEKYLPEFKGQKLKVGEDLKSPSRPIQIRDLLTHTSGMTGAPAPSMPDLYLKRQHTLEEGVKAAAAVPLSFEPGSKWAYCNLGIDTLGRIVEVVSGSSFEVFLQRRVFGPLQMKDTTFYPNAEQFERSAQTYNKKDNELVATPFTVVGDPRGAKYCLPAGGLYSTGTDLAQVYRMMLNKGKLGDVRILSEVSVAVMTKNHTGDMKAGFTEGMGFGYGFAVVRNPMGVTTSLSEGSFGHGGAFATQSWADPQKDLFVIMLIQRVGLKNADASDMRGDLQKAALSLLK